MQLSPAPFFGSPLSLDHASLASPHVPQPAGRMVVAQESSATASRMSRRSNSVLPSSLTSRSLNLPRKSRKLNKAPRMPSLRRMGHFRSSSAGGDSGDNSMEHAQAFYDTFNDSTSSRKKSTYRSHSRSFQAKVSPSRGSGSSQATVKRRFSATVSKRARKPFGGTLKRFSLAGSTKIHRKSRRDSRSSLAKVSVSLGPKPKASPTRSSRRSRRSSTRPPLAAKAASREPSPKGAPPVPATSTRTQDASYPLPEYPLLSPWDDVFGSSAWNESYKMRRRTRSAADADADAVCIAELSVATEQQLALEEKLVCAKPQQKASKEGQLMSMNVALPELVVDTQQHGFNDGPGGHSRSQPVDGDDDAHALRSRSHSDSNSELLGSLSSSSSNCLPSHLHIHVEPELVGDKSKSYDDTPAEINTYSPSYITFDDQARPRLVSDSSSTCVDKRSRKRIRSFSDANTHAAAHSHLNSNVNTTSSVFRAPLGGSDSLAPPSGSRPRSHSDSLPITSTQTQSIRLHALNFTHPKECGRSESNADGHSHPDDVSASHFRTRSRAKHASTADVARPPPPPCPSSNKAHDVHPCRPISFRTAQYSRRESIPPSRKSPVGDVYVFGGTIIFDGFVFCCVAPSRIPSFSTVESSLSVACLILSL